MVGLADGSDGTNECVDIEASISRARIASALT